MLHLQGNSAAHYAGCILIGLFSIGTCFVLFTLVLLKDHPAPVTASAGDEIDAFCDTEVVRWGERKRLMVKPEAVRRVIIDASGRRNTFRPVRAHNGHYEARRGSVLTPFLAAYV